MKIQQVQNKQPVMYELFFFCTDEDGQQVDSVKEGIFKTKEEALNRIDNIGSRWFFYPHACIVNPDGEAEIYLAN